MLVYPFAIDLSSSHLRFLSGHLQQHRRERGTRRRRLPVHRQALLVRVPYWGRWANLSAGQQAVNRSHARIRAVGEQANAALKCWRLLRKLRCSTT